MRALLFEVRTGKPLVDLDVTDWSADTGILAPDKIELTVPAYTKRSQSMDMRSLLTPYKHGVALIDDSVEGDRWVPAAGPICQVSTEQDADGMDTWKVTCYGPERLLEARHIRLYPGWPLVNAKGLPNGTYDVKLSGLQYGTIMKRLVQESEKWPGGDLPVVYEADRAGDRVREYLALDGKPLLEALDEIADVDGGVEYDFIPQLSELDEVSWLFRTGTDAARVVSDGGLTVWNLGGAFQDVSGYTRTLSVAQVATDALFTGGKEEDRVLVASSSDATLISAGWPRVEVWDSSHSSVSVQATLQAWADGRLGGTTENIEFDVLASRAHRLRHGGLVMLQAHSHWDMPDGETYHRVLSVKRSASDPAWVGIELA